MIAIVDYGVGNLFSLRSSLETLGLDVVVTADPDKLCAADRIILPGVGAFGDAIQKLQATGLVPVLQTEAETKPLLGICLGMQLLFQTSYEFGQWQGLGFVPGAVCPLQPDLEAAGRAELKVPQIGWNALQILQNDPIFKYVKNGEYVYYVHSFYGKHCAANTLAVSEYAVPVPGVVKAGRVYGMQFHPEKSGDTGLRLLKAFAEL
ncbi:MAG: imidazole glycerol phosphate synthase subunit HisH [Faecalibacterium sp.]|nr:imidazole glycerol phosphate synthase subunit HisH [Faecalibacterium sp.]